MTPPHLYYSSWGRRSGYTIDEDRVSMEFSFDTVHDSKRDSVLDENEILLRSFFYFPETKTFQIGNRNRAFAVNVSIFRSIRFFENEIVRNDAVCKLYLTG